MPGLGLLRLARSKIALYDDDTPERDVNDLDSLEVRREVRLIQAGRLEAHCASCSRSLAKDLSKVLRTQRCIGSYELEQQYPYG